METYDSWCKPEALLQAILMLWLIKNGYGVMSASASIKGVIKRIVKKKGGLIVPAGFEGIFSIAIIILSIIFVWILLGEVSWEKLLKNYRSAKARMLQVVIAIVIGYLFGNFILQYWGYSTMLQQFVE